MKVHITFLFFILTLLACKKEVSNVTMDYTYLGGEIINPNTNYIVLSKDETIIDTVKLDGRNRFLYKTNNLNEGLYTFRHGGEYQQILLEPKDSLLLRLNTLDFDESLVFSGKGDAKNNYFINEYIESEKEEKYIIELSQQIPTIFQKFVDSLKTSKTKRLSFFSSKNNPSSLFLKIANANIDYSYYLSKEVYPFVHFGENKAAILKSLPSDFYNYRKNINYNDPFLINHHNYNKFLKYNLSNLTLKAHDIHDKNACFNRSSLCFNLDRLKLVDSLITNPKVKDELLYKFTIGYLSKSIDDENNNTVLKAYLNKSKNEKNNQIVTRYASTVKNFKVGDKLPQVKLVNYKNKELSISSQIDAPTVLSFWSHRNLDHFRDTHLKLKELKIKYPEVKFISINIDAHNLEDSKKLLETYRFSNENEFIFKNPESSSDVLAIYSMKKTILLDKNSTIVNSNTNIFSGRFEQQLLGLINR